MLFCIQQEMEASPEEQSECQRERISAHLHSEASHRSRSQSIQQFGNVLHHEISGGNNNNKNFKIFKFNFIELNGYFFK